MRVQVRLRVPEISVAMDAKEFEILQDVAAHLAGEQVRVQPTTPAYWLSHLPFCLRASFFWRFTGVTGSLCFPTMAIEGWLGGTWTRC